MSEANKNILDRVAEQLEAEGLPVPPSFKGKLTTEDSLLLHIFLDHLYIQVLANLKQARKELKVYGEETKEVSTRMTDVYNWLSALVESLSEGYDIFADQIEAVPTLAVMKVFQEKLEQELSYAVSLSLDQLEKNGNGSTN